MFLEYVKAHELGLEFDLSDPEGQIYPIEPQYSSGVFCLALAARFLENSRFLLEPLLLSQNFGKPLIAGVQCAPFQDFEPTLPLDVQATYL